MAGLSDHFGEDASLPKTVTASIAAYLEAYAAEAWDTEAGNAMRIRRLALAVFLGEVSRAAVVYAANAYVAAQFAADHLRFTARPRINGFAIVSALILLVLAEVFRTGTQLDEDQSLTV